MAKSVMEIRPHSGVTGRTSAVDTDDVVAPSQQPIDKMRPDEAGRAGHNNTHDSISLSSLGLA